MEFNWCQTYKYVVFAGKVEIGTMDEEHDRLLGKIAVRTRRELNFRDDEAIVEALRENGGDMGRFTVEALPDGNNKGWLIIEPDSNSRRYDFPPEDDKEEMKRIKAGTPEVFERAFPNYRCTLGDVDE